MRRLSAHSGSDRSTANDVHLATKQTKQSAKKKKQNTLYYGDNLDVLRRHVKDESVDLVYLDPPFNSTRAATCCSLTMRARVRQRRSAHSRTRGGGTKPPQLPIKQAVEQGGAVADVLRAFAHLLGLLGHAGVPLHDGPSPHRTPAGNRQPSASISPPL